MCRSDVVRFCQCLLPSFIKTEGQFGPGHKSVTLPGKIVGHEPNPITGRGSNFPKIAELLEREPGTALAHVSGTPGQKAATGNDTTDCFCPGPCLSIHLHSNRFATTAYTG
jgi:hypothetical protein